MRSRIFVGISSLVVFVIAATSASATDRAWNQSSGSNDWATSGNWTPNGTVVWGDYGFITNNPTAGTTNIVYRDGNWGGGGFEISNSGAGGNNKLLINSGHFDNDWVTIGAKGIVEVGNGASLSTYQDMNLNSGGTLLLNGGSKFTYHGNTDGDFDFAGTIVVRAGAGNTGTYDSTDDSLHVLSGGRLIAESGTFWANPRDAWNNDGMTIDSGGTLQVNNGATFVLDRTASAWDGSSNPNISGTVLMDGGTFQTARAGAINNTMTIETQSGGVILGKGFLDFAVRNDSGSLLASNGVLVVTGKIVGAGGTFGAKNSGTLEFRGGAAGAGDNLSGGALNIEAGSAVNFAGDSDWTISDAASYAGATIIASNATGGANVLFLNNASFRNNAGTISTVGNEVNYGQIGGDLTNAATGYITGSGTIVGEYAGANRAIQNKGTIATVASGTLTLSAHDAFNFGGVQNAAGGVFDIANGSALVIMRSNNAWTAANAVYPTNSGTIQLGGGTLRGGVIDGGVASRFVNASGGVIRGNGTLADNFTTLQNSGSIFANSAAAPLVVNSSFFVNQASGVFTADTARTIVNAAYTNLGTTVYMNSIGTFNAAVVNAGNWITDPSTNVFQNTMTVTSSGDIQAAAGDVYIFREHFVNQSAQNTTYDTMNTTPGSSGAAGTKFIFDDQSSNGTQAFYTAGVLLTGGFVGTPSPLVTGVQTVSSFAAVTGFIDNFALDRLEIGNANTNSTLMLVDTFGTVSADDGNIASLFVNDLWIFGSSHLVLSNNTRLYFVNSNSWTSANFTLLGNAQLHQLVLGAASAVPEPSVVLLWLAGLGTVYAARRRARR